MAPAATCTTHTAHQARVVEHLMRLALHGTAVLLAGILLLPVAAAAVAQRSALCLHTFTLPVHHGAAGCITAADSERPRCLVPSAAAWLVAYFK